jgi:hypothetical protein
MATVARRDYHLRRSVDIKIAGGGLWLIRQSNSSFDVFVAVISHGVRDQPDYR